MHIDGTEPVEIEQETAIEVEPDEEVVDIDADEGADEDLEADPEAPEDEEGEEGEEQQGEIEYAEIELNGKKYQVPSELKDGYMMQADYTRKTQGVAEEKTAVAAEKQAVEAMREATQEELSARAQLLAINQRLEEYKKLGPNDWNAWEDEDPFAAQRGFREFQTLQQQATQANEYLQDGDKRRAEAAQQDIAKRVQETREYAAKEIKGWSPDLDNKIIEFATKDMGISQQELARAINPVVYKTLHLAWVGSQALAKSQSAKPTAKVTKLAPTAKVSAKGGVPARKALDEMSMEEYADYRNKQEANKAKR